MKEICISEKASALRHARNIGITLGPGLPAGLSDAGLLMALKELNIPIALISGTGIGAVLGALYASGISASEIQKILIKMFKKEHLHSLKINRIRVTGSGMFPAEIFIDELIKHAGWDPEFHELMLPFYVIAFDKKKQKSVVIRHGRVLEAVRASMALLPSRTDRQLGNMELVDSAEFSPVNTDVLYDEGADIVIAIYPEEIRSSPHSTRLWRTQWARYFPRLSRRKTDRDRLLHQLKYDILLRPRVPSVLFVEEVRVDKIIDIGRRVTHKALELLERKSAARTKSLPTISKFGDIEVQTQATQRLEKEITDIDSYLRDIARRASTMSDPELMDEFPRFEKRIHAFLEKLAQWHPDTGQARELLKSKMKILAEHVNDSPFLDRCLSKPLGYAGDFQMMNYIYDNDVFEARSNMGKLLNYLSFISPSSNAVKNRSKIIQGLLLQRIIGQGEIAVASIACGPAREVAGTIKLLSHISNQARINWTLLDQDSQALDYARSHTPSHPNIVTNWVKGSVVDIIRKSITLDPQDIIYSLGLFDYLNDRVATLLLKRLYAALKPGGALLIGNFSYRHPDFSLLESLTEWHLIFRTEEDLLRLGKEAARDGTHFVMAEPEGLNYILVITKPAKQTFSEIV